MCGQPEQGFERNVPVEAAIVAKDEFIEIGVDMRAAQAMIRARGPIASSMRRLGGSRARQHVPTIFPTMRGSCR